MLKRTLLTLSVASSLCSYAQDNKAYSDWVQKANSYYGAKEYRKSGEAFSKAFESLGWKGYPDDRYNAACSWAMAGVADSAFFMLNVIATKTNYTDLNHLLVDTDLQSLHNDKRWDEVVRIVKANKEKAEANLDKRLVAILDTIYQEDQGDRMKADEIMRKHGNDSKEARELWSRINYKDSINLIKVTAILDKYGWLGPDVVGNAGNQTLFLVIQHSDIKIQEKYLPMMREAVKAGKAQPSALALLEDRVALGQGKKQIYGSQIGMKKDGSFYVQNLADPDNVDKRRAEVGLPPLSEYVKHWELKWNVEEYKKQLPEIEKMDKDQRD